MSGSFRKPPWPADMFSCQLPVNPAARNRDIADCYLRRRCERTRVQRDMRPGAHLYSARTTATAQMCLVRQTSVRHGGGMPPAVWDSDRQLRHDALWKDADQILTTRAMTRCALAIGWIALTALTIAGYAWTGGIPMLLASGISLLHASHTLVVRIEEHLPGWPRRLFERLFIYPDEPHLNWVGVTELAGLVTLGMVTGWPGRMLAADPAAAAAGSG